MPARPLIGAVTWCAPSLVLIHVQRRLARRGIGGGDLYLRRRSVGLGHGSQTDLASSSWVRLSSACALPSRARSRAGWPAAGDLCLKFRGRSRRNRKISGLNVRTVVDVPLDDGAIHASPHGDSRRWFDPADARPCDGHRLCPDRSGDDSDRGCALLRERAVRTDAGGSGGRLEVPGKPTDGIGADACPSAPANAYQRPPADMTARRRSAVRVIVHAPSAELSACARELRAPIRRREG